MAVWPKDHPGRTCKTCGERPYALWVGDEPPPGTCIEKAETAGACRQFLAGLVLGRQLHLSRREPPSPAFLARLERSGLTLEALDEEIALRAQISDAGRRLAYGTSDEQALGVEVQRWLAQDGDPRVAFLSLLKHMVENLELVDGERTAVEIDDLATDIAARSAEVLTGLRDIDVEG